MENKNGDLYTHNLWSFWDSISVKNKEEIIEVFSKTISTAMFWDYKTLFEGKEKKGDVLHGDIGTLTNLLCIDDIEYNDKVFSKFLEYKADKYLNYSFWGTNWHSELNRLKLLLKNSDSNFFVDYNNITSEDVYWCDAHFFNMQYAKRVYKYYLNGICGIERFENAVKFEYENSENIHSAIQKIIRTNVRNSIFEQYLIYLEKQKMYSQCLELMQDSRIKKWNSDNNKRFERCKLKLSKSNGN